MERSRGRGAYSQASSIIVVISNGVRGGDCRSMSQRLLHRQDLRYVQSIVCSMYDIVTFLVARKKHSDFHSDLCYVNQRKTPPTNAGQCNANAPSNGIEQEQIQTLHSSFLNELMIHSSIERQKTDKEICTAFT